MRIRFWESLAFLYLYFLLINLVGVFKGPLSAYILVTRAKT